MEDVTPYNDTQVSAASRVVHQGCASVLKEYFEIAPLHGGKEGDKIAVDTAADPNRFRLLGKVVGNPPFKGVVVHRGWKTARLTLPRLSRPVEAAGDNLIAPIEVELK
jgi:hypothetical protein